MAHTSLQVCIDSSDWLQGTKSEEMSTGLLEHSSSSLSGGTITDECMLAAACSSRAGPPLMERKLRPPHDQNLKCPRPHCESTHTKFCYYNNYSLSQPRYFCKACRRYWTQGGTLRNIPVGGGCRKNKKSSSKKSSDHRLNQHHSLSQGSVGGGGGGSASLVSNSTNPTQLHLSFPEVQFPPQLANLIGAQMSINGGNFMENGLSLLRPIAFMESKYEGLVGGNLTRGSHDFMGSNGNFHEFGVMGDIGDHHVVNNGNSHGVYNGINLSPFGHHDHIGNNSGISFMDQRLLLPFDGNNENHEHQNRVVDVKPNPKLLSLEWQDQDDNNVGKDTPFGYNVSGSLSSWSGMMAGFQPSTTNSLV